MQKDFENSSDIFLAGSADARFTGRNNLLKSDSILDGRKGTVLPSNINDLDSIPLNNRNSMQELSKE